jgi:hypothetical protein
VIKAASNQQHVRNGTGLEEVVEPDWIVVLAERPLSGPITRGARGGDLMASLRGRIEISLVDVLIRRRSFQHPYTKSTSRAEYAGTWVGRYVRRYLGRYLGN